MRLVVFQYKGGVSKTSIAINIALTYNMRYVTNDLVTDLKKYPSLEKFKLQENRKKIPTKFLKDDKDIIFDMGAMSGAIDFKIIDAIESADVIIIPTFTDQRSIDGAIQSIKFADNSCHNIFIIINRVMKDKDYQDAFNQLSQYINVENIFMMKDTTLFKRISKDGDEWYKNIHNKNGDYMLRRTIQRHNEIYEVIYNI